MSLQILKEEQEWVILMKCVRCLAASPYTQADPEPEKKEMHRENKEIGEREPRSLSAQNPERITELSTYFNYCVMPCTFSTLLKTRTREKRTAGALVMWLQWAEASEWALTDANKFSVIFRHRNSSRGWLHLFLGFVAKLPNAWLT